MKAKVWVRSLAMCGMALLLWGGGTSPARAQRFYQCEDGEVPDVKVFAAESARQADWCVYFTYDAGDKVGDGVVYQTVKREDADFSLAFVDSPKEADLSLWIVEDPSKAGWRNKQKSTILEKYIKRNE